MKFYKILNAGYVEAIGTGAGGTEVAEAEYNEIMAVIQSCPQAEGKGYKLKADLTWEEYDLPPVVVSDDDELSADEALEILLGGAI